MDELGNLPDQFLLEKGFSKKLMGYFVLSSLRRGKY